MNEYLKQIELCSCEICDSSYMLSPKIFGNVVYKLETQKIRGHYICNICWIVFSSYVQHFEKRLGGVCISYTDSVVIPELKEVIEICCHEKNFDALIKEDFDPYEILIKIKNGTINYDSIELHKKYKQSKDSICE